MTYIGKGTEKTHLKYNEPIIEHNIPEKYIIDLNDLKCKYFETSDFWRHCYMYLTEDDFNIISNK